jgi:hypothetical protein
MDLEGDGITGGDGQSPKEVYEKLIDDAFKDLPVDSKLQSYIPIRKDKFLQDIK